MSRSGNDASPRRSLGLSRGSALALALLFALFSWLYVHHPPGRFTQGGLAHGDGVYYYVYTRSLVLDRDLDLANDYELLGEPHEHGEGPRGRAENRFAVGTGILWIPTFVVAHAVARAGTAAGWIDDACDGSSALYQRITFFGSLLWAMGALVLAVRLAARYVNEALATTAAIAIALASPLTWYALYQPSWPHTTSAFVVAAFVWVWHEHRTDRSTRGWAWLGALAGLMMLVRPQNVAFLGLPAFDLAAALVWAGRVRDRGEALRLVGHAALLLGCSALVFTPQMWVWASIYGDPLVIPQGTAFMRWGDSKWVETLFSSRNGLLSWTPLVSASLLGLLALGFRRAAARNLVGLLLLAFCLQAYINGSVDDWWGGWAFGGRRFTNCTVLFVLGCAYGLHALRRVFVERRRLVAGAGIGLLLLLTTTYNASLMWDYGHAQMTRGFSQPMQPATERWATRLVSGWYTALGHPGSFPANLVHAWRAGVSPARYDHSSGWELATDRGRPRGWDRIWFNNERWAGEGFGPGVKVQGVSASWVEQQAVFMVPVRYATELHAAIRLRPAWPDTHVTVELGGHRLMDRSLESGWHWYQLTIPADALEPGLNYAHVTQQPAADRPRPVWPVGRTERSTHREIEVTSQPDGDAPLRFVLDRTTIDIAARGITAFAVEAEPEPDDPGYRPLGTFDTAVDVHAADRLARTIERLEPGQIVVLGLSRSALRRWTSRGDEALAMLGGRRNLAPEGKGTHYALIGVVGAPVGTAPEALFQDAAARLRVGRRADLRSDGVAWASLVLWRTELPTPEPLENETLRPAL